MIVRLSIFSLPVCWLLAGLAIAETLSGRVVRVDAGNRLTLVDRQNVLHQVTLQALEVPPATSVPGSASRSNLERLVSGKYITVEYGRDADFGSPTGTVYLGDTNVNRMQLRAGMAKYRNDTNSPLDSDGKQDREAQEAAIRDGRGLWAAQASGPVEPQYETVLVPVESPKQFDTTRYPPQPQRSRYHYAPRDIELKQDSAPVELNYAPLTDRESAPYGAWALENGAP